MARIGIRHLTRRYDDGRAVLDDLSFEVNDSEFLVIVGPSGCGKSTLLRLVAGLDTPTSGEIRIDDTVVNDRPPQARNIAMVFQNYALYPHMSVRRNMEFPLRMMRLPRAQIAQRVARISRLLDLDRLLDRKPAQLSGGQRQRVAMGRALVRDPTAFLLDEPLSNLDAQLRASIRTEIAALQKELDITTIYVTHDQQEAMTLGQRVLVLNEGRLQQLAPPQELYRRPANTFVAQFIGSPGMNILPAVLRCDAAGRLYCVSDAGDLYLDPDPYALDRSGTHSIDDLLRASFACSAASGSLRSRTDQPLLLGLRPEAFSVSDGTDADGSLTVNIHATEMLGHEMLVYCRPAVRRISPAEDGASLVARLPVTARVPDSGILRLHVAINDLTLFHKDGTALT